jgi:hypothetical protein
MGKRLGIGTRHSVDKRHSSPGARTHGASGLIGAAWALAAALVLSGCTAGAIAPVHTRTPSPSPTPSSTYVAPPPTELAPLRGTTVPAGSLAHASVAAKIDNHPDARPQVGLERTDLVFEELVEGGLTRYVALWQSDIPDLLGPVRSIRPMDPDILSPFAGIVCYSGGQQRFVDLMRHTPVYNAIHGQPDTAATFYRTKDKRAPHNVIVKAKEVLAQHASLPAPGQQFAYAADVASATAAKDGSPTAVVNYSFAGISNGSWTYDAATKLFLRAQNGHADMDSAGHQLTATNVVVLRVGIDNSLGVPKTLLIGSGEAWVSTGGGTVHATWSKASATAPIAIVDDNGVAVRLAAGNTWIEMIPTAGSVQFAAA